MRLALAAVAALALAASACGGVESEPNLAQAAEKTEARGSFAFEVTNRASDGESSSGTCDGVVDNVRKLARFTCDDDVIGAFEVVMVDDMSYQRDLGQQTWTKQLAPEENALNEFSPSEILEILGSASQKTEHVGEEEVRGEPTVRYGLTVDCEKAELDAECAGETAVVDVWIDEGGLVRRIRFDEPRAEASFDLEFFGFGVAVDVAAPPADEVEEAPLEPKPGPCQIDEANPVGVEQAIDAFRRNGFDVRRSPGNCGPGIASEFGTSIPTRGEDQLSCQVFVEGVSLSTDSSNGMDRALENLVCHLLPTDGESDEAVDRLDAAFAELKRELGP
jgi:hypothetical protein